MQQDTKRNFALDVLRVLKALSYLPKSKYIIG